MLVNDKYDLFEISEEDYINKLNFIKEGFGEKIAYIVYFTDNYNTGELKLRNMIVRRLGDNIQLDDKKILLKYYVTHLSLYDKIQKTDMEDFDYIKIEEVGYYRFTDFYKSFGIKNQIEDSLIEEIEQYEKAHLNNHLAINEEDYLKDNTKKYFKKNN